MRHYHPKRVFHPTTQRFIFATAIECSYPTIETPQGRRRIDQLEKTRHYERWREDFQLARELGIHYLRYGPPYYRIHQGPGKFDWSFTDEVLPELRQMGMVPIVDLCHFGVPDWIGDFQNPDFPKDFAEYAAAFARRYEWVWAYTPINEMYITAEFSAYRGWWNESMKSDRGFVTAIKHLARGCLNAMLVILQTRPDALFVLAESSEHTHPRRPELSQQAEFYNQRRFLLLDLLCGRRINAGIYDYIRSNGMREEEYEFFLRHDLREHFIMGDDYDKANEHVLIEPEKRERSGDLLGYYVLAWHYFHRYGLPVMQTDTGAPEPEAVDWLWKTWTNIQQLRRDGVPLCGMTWSSLVDSIDWDTALREQNNRVYPTGLYDLDRQIRPVGEEYRKLIRQWQNTPLVPNGPLTLHGKWGRAEQTAAAQA